MKKIFLAVGCAPCAINDIYEFYKMIQPEDIENIQWCAVGIDAALLHHWKIDYFVTYHPEDIQPAILLRNQRNWNTDFVRISYTECLDIYKKIVDVFIPHKEPSGGSALLAVLAAKELGFEKVVLCGCPMIGTSTSFINYDYAKFQDGWDARFDEIKDVARSMSGWTKEKLGAPTKEWLND
jgi:hypothetical protein